MSVLLLLMHGLVSVALLGALTHQAVALIGGRRTTGQPASRGFLGRYLFAGRAGFATAVAWLYVVCFVLGALIYPAYRLDVRIPFEEMGLFVWVGLFEVKEHWAGVGIGVLPLYIHLWKSEHAAEYRWSRAGVTLVLLLIVWSDFLAGHFLNNTRGLG